MCATVITILSEYRNPDAPRTFTAFGSPVASWPNSTAVEGTERGSVKSEIHRAITLNVLKTLLIVTVYGKALNS
jgi:hypothetical protein